MRRTIPRPPSKRRIAAWQSFASGDLAAMPKPVKKRSTPKKQAESAVNDALIKVWRLLHGTLYRNRRGMVRLPNGGMFPYGLGPNGSGDVIGWTRVRITPAMVGKALPIYTEFESKTEAGRLEEHQIQRIEMLREENAIAGCVRSDLDAEALLTNWTERVTR